MGQGKWKHGALWVAVGAAGLMLWHPASRAAEVEIDAPDAADAAAPEKVERQDTVGTPDVRAEEAEEAEEASGPNTGRISLAINSDFTTAYFFRGILQERNGFIWEPSGDISINLYAGDGPLSSVDVGFNAWASIHSNKTLASGSGPSNIYEVDYTPYFTLGWSNGFETSLSYPIFTSPNGAFATVQQIDVGIAYDDSELLGAYALAPSITLSFETDNTNFGTAKKGGYFELAGGPSFEVTLDDAGDYPITTSVPLALALSLYNYYNDGTNNDTFGFFSFGLTTSMPLAFIPEDYGSWSIGAGINVLVLSDTLKDVNQGDSPFPIGTGTITMEY